MIPKRPFGSTGLSVSPIGLGTVKLGRDRGLKLAGSFTIPDDAAALRLIGLAADLGINLIDTAPAYGSSEERLGPLLAGQRDRWVICTKVGEEFDAATATSRFDFTPEHVRSSVERSLKRLRTDFLDIVLVHSDGNDLDIIDRLGTLDALNMLKAAGKVGATGISTKTVAGGLRALEKSDCAMVTYNLAQSDEGTVIDRAKTLGKGILVKKPLASGHAATASGDPVLESFRHILARDGVGAMVVGTIDPAHLKANVEACARVLSELA